MIMYIYQNYVGYSKCDDVGKCKSEQEWITFCNERAPEKK